MAQQRIHMRQAAVLLLELLQFPGLRRNRVDLFELEAELVFTSRPLFRVRARCVDLPLQRVPLGIGGLDGCRVGSQARVRIEDLRLDLGTQ